MRKCFVDICVIGEGRDTIVHLADYWQKQGDLKASRKLKGVKGITYIDKADNKLIFTGYPEPVAPERLGCPNYDILGDYYLTDPNCSLSFLKDPRSGEGHRKNKKTAVLELSKGCVGRCTFCHRWDKGYRMLKLDTIIEQIKYLKERFNVGFINFMDENFGASKAYLQEFCLKIKPLDILWHVGGMRVRSADSDTFKKMHECGCVSVYLGIESGSDKMLKIMEKGVAAEDNLRAIRALKESGLSTIIQLVIGMPGEDSQTIAETVEFVKKAREILGQVTLSINYAQTLPGTPLYEYARMKGYIGKTVDSEEEYLLKISDTNAAEEKHFINMTGEKLSSVLLWKYLIQKESFSREDLKTTRAYKYKISVILRKLFGETFVLFLAKAWRCYQASRSLPKALAILVNSRRAELKVKPESLRKALIEEDQGVVVNV